MSKTVFVNEIFFSFQGEGIFVGQPQTFVRFNGCDIKCKWCDESEKTPQGLFSVSDIMNEINRFKNLSSVVSLTGGEPLLHKEFLKEFLPVMVGKGFMAYLETNGIQYAAFSEISGYIDTVAMDIKLPSACGEEFWKEHKKFMQLAVDKKLFVKIVVCPDTPAEEFEKTVFLIREVSENIPLVIQPEWNSMRMSDISRYDRFLEVGRRCLCDVRVVPQIHKILGLK